MVRNLIRPAVMAVFAVLAALALTGPARAQAPRILKFAHVFPASHYLWEQGGQVLANELDKIVAGRFKFEVYPAGQLGKDYYALLRSGIADIALLIPSYAPEKFPLTSVSELPGLYGTACEATNKLWAIAKPGGLLDKNEFEPLGLHILLVTVLPSYTIMTAAKPVTTLEELNGLKMRGNGAAMDKTIRALGAVPVRVASPELYDALTRGTVDGASFPYSGLPTYRLEKVLKHSVMGAQLGSGSVLYGMTTKTWNGLAEDLRDALTKASATTQASLCNWQDEEEARVRERIVAQDGHQISTLSAKEAGRWNERLSSVAAAWAQEADANGKKGSEVLRAFKAAPATQ